MAIPGLNSVSPLNPLNGPELVLRPFQRVTAQVLSVTATTAVLSIDGYPIVAQLSTADQATALLAQRSAQFVITQLNNQTMTLKFIRTDQAPMNFTGYQIPGAELATRILDQNGIVVTESNLMLARSALQQHLPITPDLLNELMGVLAELGSWGDAEVELAAAMKAAGLPLSVQSLSLAARQNVQYGEAIGQLINALGNAFMQNLPADTKQSLTFNIQMLKEMVVQWTGDSAPLKSQVKNSVEIIGRTLENLLLELSKNPEQVIPEKSLLSLAKLQQLLQKDGVKDAAQAVEKFITDVRQNQLLNVKPDPVPGRGDWSEIGFLLQPGKQLNIDQNIPARLRIAREAGPESGKINPAYTRLILQVDIHPGETIEVDLSLVGKQIRTSVTASDPVWVKNAQGELPRLQEALQELGYMLKETQIGIGYPRPFGALILSPGSTPRMNVDIEV